MRDDFPLRKRDTVKHHAALKYDDLPAFIETLRDEAGGSTAALALEFCILTATRTNETMGVVWSEFDLARTVWTIPKARMKAGYEHRIPLPPRAVAILQEVEKARSPLNEFVFPGLERSKPLSNMAMMAVLERMGMSNITVHGFRSTFRDWASKRTNFSHETTEHALAHQISDKAESAYRRGDQFEKRCKLIEVWQAFGRAKPKAKVVPLKR